ncbi:MAG: secretin N-terminal domain-containing protein [Campylobacterota bacterium]|nr:secretin N-terminal domain-containing protein [Campylobacterota bacterium]
MVKSLYVAFLVVMISVTSLQASWKSSEMFQRTSVDENIKDILTAIALQNSSQIIFGKDIEGTETLTVNEMPLEGAFNLILDRNSLSYKWEKNTLIVTSTAVNVVKKEFIILQNLSTTKLKALLKRYNVYEQVKRKVIFDAEMSAVYIEAKSEVIDDLKNLISQFEIAENLLKERRLKDKEYALKEFALQEKAGKKESVIAKKKKFGLGAYDEWKMVVSIIPIRYINVSSNEVEFQGEKIQVDSLEDTLMGLIGTGYVTKPEITTKDGKQIRKVRNPELEDKPYLKLDKRTNSIIVKDYPDKIAEIKKIITQLDKPSELVEIEVTIATGNTGFTEQLGVNLGASKSYDGRDYGVSTSSNVAENINALRTTETASQTTTNNGVSTSTEVASVNSAFSTTELLQPTGALGLTSSMLFLGQKSALNFQLNAMEEEGLGKVLSNPRIITLNNREATIVSGNSVSVPTATADKMGLETIDTGISIKSTPHIIQKKGENFKEILLDISIESSALGIVTREKIETSTNQINTNVVMRDGQTLILGGLFQYTKSDSHGGVPLLKDIPVLGLLFSTKSESLNKNELLFFITPRVVTSKMVNAMQNGQFTHYQNSLKNSRDSFNKDLDNEDNKDEEDTTEQ